MSALWGWAAIVVCCAPAHSDDSFQKRLVRDCATEATCRVFTSEAENRARHCRSRSMRGATFSIDEQSDVGVVAEPLRTDARAVPHAHPPPRHDQAVEDQVHRDGGDDPV